MTNGPGEHPSIAPIVELFRADCIAFWATTYNLDLAFFNEYLLRRLGDPPLNVVVLADQERLDRSLERSVDRPDLLSTINRRWLLRGVRPGAGRFHPKSYLAVTPRAVKLLIGSGNLSTGGIDTGRETFVAFNSGTPEGDAAIEAWRSWTRRLVIELDDTRLAERFAALETALPESAKLRSVAASPLFHNLDKAIGDQFCELISLNQVDELIVTAPFYDERGGALGQLADRLGPSIVRLYTTSTTSVDGAALLARLNESGARIQTFAYLPDQFTHAKLVGVVAGSRAWILSGSANLSHAALTLRADSGNVELAVVAESTPDIVRSVFEPRSMSIEERAIATLAELTYDGTDDGATLALEARLLWAAFRADDLLEVTADVPIDAAWRLADHHAQSKLSGAGNSAISTEALSGPMVRLVNPVGDPVSNWVVADDPAALAQALRGGERSAERSRPAELTAGDLDTPLGRALLLMHRDMVMDISERSPIAGAGEIGAGEATSGTTDDSLWERLERETLGRDPRAASYARWLTGGSGGAALGLAEPIVELLDAMRYRVPVLDPQRSLLQVLVTPVVPEPGPEPENDTRHHWSEGARIRVRARNVLRRWAAAQTDNRLAWVDPFAPLLNLEIAASTFLTLWPQTLGAVAGTPELTADDLDDLWARWFRPFVGTNQNDGWLDRTDVPPDELRRLLDRGVAANITALCWLAIRPGSDHRSRVVSWQPALRAAFNKGLIDDNEEVAAYVSHVTRRPITRDQVSSDLFDSLTFIDDDLWCHQMCESFGLAHVELGGLAADQAADVRLEIAGIERPLFDARLLQIIVAVREYRGADVIAVYSTDHDWRIVIETGEPTLYKRDVDSDMIESLPLADGRVEELAAKQGTLADLFPAAARVA